MKTSDRRAIKADLPIEGGHGFRGCRLNPHRSEDRVHPFEFLAGGSGSW
jgi:hypothetical protein